jgi:hypothetical protein
LYDPCFQHRWYTTVTPSLEPVATQVRDPLAGRNRHRCTPGGCLRFPVGTRLWRQFSVDGRPVESRYLERRRSGSLFATYVWNEMGTSAVLAPETGTVRTVAGAPGGRYEIPGTSDCRACHEAGHAGAWFRALQLRRIGCEVRGRAV